MPNHRTLPIKNMPIRNLPIWNLTLPLTSEQFSEQVMAWQNLSSLAWKASILFGQMWWMWRTEVKQQLCWCEITSTSPSPSQVQRLLAFWAASHGCSWLVEPPRLRHGRAWWEADGPPYQPDMADVEKASNLARHRDREEDYIPRF